ncbi:MAG TPA: alkaline phosphatase family protein [Candidatus Binatia bacterium]|nr:alkaline phosphatase family protein [Candidatus Binatia bacterium]
MTSIKIIHVGVGGRGRHWLDFVAQHPDFAAVACVDIDKKALESIRQASGQEHGKFFTRLEDALAHTEADAALITSPSFLHAQQALQALEAGLAVMVEKPFGCSLQEAMNVVDRSRAVCQPVMVAENYRFFQAERTLRHLLDEGVAGRIAGAVCIDRRNQPSHTQGSWVRGMADPFLSEIAVHHFDSFRYLFNRHPVSILASSHNPSGSDYDRRAAVNALIEFDGGLPIQYSGTLVANRYEYSLWVEGDKGDIWTDRRRVWWRPKGSRFFRPVKPVPVPKGDEERYPKAGTVSLLNQFRDALIQGTVPETSGEDNLWTLAMMEAGILSTREDRKVEITEVFTPTVRHNAVSQNGNGKVSLITEIALPSKQRLLFVGLDAADTELIEQWCQEGHLPNISQMRSRGTWAHMRTTAEVVHVSAWPSIFTGAAPDEHGLYHAYVMQPGQQSPVRPRPDQSPIPFLWKLLSDHGKRCIIIDAFMTCPLQNFNGTQIVEWGTWSWFSEPTISPESVKRELQKKFGSYPAEDHSKVGMTPPPDPQGFHQRLLSAVAKKTEVVKWLMAKEDWDLFLVVFGESHPAGHYFWHYHDPSYVTHSQEPPGQSALRDVYIALDKAIGEILKGVDHATTVFLVSGDGMGPNYSGSHILNDLLARMKLFNNIPATTNGAAGKEDGKNRAAKADLMSTVRNMIPKSFRVAVSRTLLPRKINEKLSLRWKTAGISWQHTRAFLIENANEGYIRINLKGREPQGVVAPGKEYEELCEELYQTIKSAINPANGKRAAHTVYKTDDIYDGPCRGHMPDIIINWDDDAKVTTGLLTEKHGLAHSAQPGHALTPYYTGNHRPTAFAVALGPGVAQANILNGVSILDLAPTILTYFGITPPDYMGGKVLDDLCPAASKSSFNAAKSMCSSVKPEMVNNV